MVDREYLNHTDRLLLKSKFENNAQHIRRCEADSTLVECIKLSVTVLLYYCFTVLQFLW